MKSLLVTPFLAGIVVATSTAVGVEQPAEDPIIGASTVHGCYGTLGGLKLNGTNAFNSVGACAEACRQTDADVAAVRGNSCYCGNEYPPASVLLDDSSCDEPCPGFVTDACGGVAAFTVINTGLNINVKNSTDSSSSEVSISATDSSSPTSAASVETVSGTVVVTATALQNSTATATGSVSMGTSSTGTGNYTGATGSGSASSSSPSGVGKSGAVSQISQTLGGLSMAILALGTVLLM